MTINEQVKIISSIKEYIYNTFKINEIELNNSTRKYIKDLLKSIRNNNLKVKRLRLKREKLRQDIQDLEASFVGSQAFDGVRTGKNTGLIPNTIEIKYLKKQTLKEELYDLVVSTLELEKSLEDNNNLVQSFIELIPNESYRMILKLTYVDCLSAIEIASMLNYCIESIETLRWRGIRELTRMLKKTVNNN